MRSLFRSILSGIIAVAGASAALIYDHGTPDHVSAYDMTLFEQTDNFNFPSTQTVVAVQFWAAYATPSNFSGSIYYRFYDNAASGNPGNLLGSGNTTATATPTGVIQGEGLSEYIVQFNLVSSLSLTGALYLSLHEGPYDTSDGSTVYWETSGPGSHYQRFNGVSGVPINPQVAGELAFQLFDAPIGAPEPASLAIAIGGLAAIAIRRSLRPQL